MSEIILETSGLTKEFRGFVAVKDVDLKVRRGTIHALIGPNGAGKTTFFNLLTKFLTPSGGQIHSRATTSRACSRPTSRACGLVRSFQISAVFPHLSGARERARGAAAPAAALASHFWRSEQRAATPSTSAAMELLDAVGLAGLRAIMPAVELPYGRKRALEIATTLALDPEMMLLDEPMAGMGHEDIEPHRRADPARRRATARC